MHVIINIYLHARVTVSLFCMFVSVSNSLDRPMSKRCTGLSTCVLGRLSQDIHKLQTYPRTDVGAGTPGKKRSLSEQYENYGKSYNWNSQLSAHLSFCLSEWTFACSSGSIHLQDCWCMWILFVWLTSKKHPCFSFPLAEIRFMTETWKLWISYKKCVLYNTIKYINS